MIPSELIWTIGIIAACCSTFAMLPQAFRVWKTRQVDQLSFKTLTLMMAGSVLWLAYGLMRIDWIIIGANVIAFFIIGYVYLEKIKSIRKHRDSKRHHV